ncbi:hypothetical protein Pla175_26230 [Pirellulimonas nuda]|uniref:Uncharacterized protein n=1 Tax=Pirellulimonas nuda TaxID=2528009 RepID=A0A518DCT3_9BACT|nr:hypothetical protein [Pirellulimonas nuda]QDU89236.1 hypothetical protein Pla175_26230 [Pirellulimonas nuda]
METISCKSGGRRRLAAAGQAEIYTGLPRGSAWGGSDGPFAAYAPRTISGDALPGRLVAAHTDADCEQAYWRRHFRGRPYASAFCLLEDYGPAYRYGWESRCRYDIDEFDSVEPELAQGWYERRGGSMLIWRAAMPAAKDAWQRVTDRCKAADRGCP